MDGIRLAVVASIYSFDGGFWAIFIEKHEHRCKKDSTQAVYLNRTNTKKKKKKTIILLDFVGNQIKDFPAHHHLLLKQSSVTGKGQNSLDKMKL